MNDIKVIIADIDCMICRRKEALISITDGDIKREINQSVCDLERIKCGLIALEVITIFIHNQMLGLEGDTFDDAVAKALSDKGLLISDYRVVSKRDVNQGDVTVVMLERASNA